MFIVILTTIIIRSEIFGLSCLTSTILDCIAIYKILKKDIRPKLYTFAPLFPTEPFLYTQ